MITERALWLRARIPWALVVLFALGAVIAAVIAWQAATAWIAGPDAGTTASSVEALYDFAAQDATPSQPVGIAVSGDRVYVADARRSRIEVYSRDGGHLSSIGVGYLKTPVHVAVGPVDGRLYVSDRGLDAVVVYSVTGTRLSTLAPGGTEPTSTPAAWRPLVLAFAGDGTLYVADSSSPQQIVVFSATGRRIAAFGSQLPPGRSGSALAFPNGIAVSDETVFVADSNNGRILVLKRDGGFVREVPTNGLPRGIAATGDGGFVVADAAMNSVTAYSPTGGQLAVAGISGVTAGLFSAPSGVAIADDGRMFVSSTAAGRVQVIRMSGAVAYSTSSARRPWLWSALAIAFASMSVVVGILARRFPAGVVQSEPPSGYNREAG